MLYLTSDLHFGHRKVTQMRGWDSPEDHDQSIIDSWRRQVRSPDHVWILGDLAASSPQQALDILKGLPGVKHLVAGNHDTCHPMHRNAWRQQRRYLEVFESVQSAARRRIAYDGQRVDVMLSHFPYRGDHTVEERHLQWRLRDCGAWLLHGHTHSSQRREFPRSVNVGWDAWGQLVPWSEVEKIVRGV